MGKAKIEHCGSHFVDKFRKKRNKYFGKKVYRRNLDVQKWCDRLKAIRFLPGDEMAEFKEDLLKEARHIFNEDKQGQGTKGSIFRACVKLCKYMDKVFLDGTHSTCESLSCTTRFDFRSCQPMEQSNRVKNDIMKDIRPAGKVTGEDWLELAATLEKRTVDRLHRIKNFGQWKEKKDTQKARDKAYQTVFNEYDGGDIDQKEYIRKIVKMSQKNEEEDIANGAQNPADAESSDSDSD